MARQGIVYHGGGSNTGCRQKRQGMRAAYKGYEESYINGYADALEDMRRWQQERRQREQDRQARRWYFLKQRALGAAVLVFTVLAVWALEGDATIALITVPLGLALVFSRQKLVVNDYYFETEEEAGGQ
ncbi:MAG: hypothetical protein NC131_10405 [Roseburia sp.]|nr:hypothetical protein [Roseburia sp.]